MKSRTQVAALIVTRGVARVMALLLLFFLVPAAKAANTWDGGGADDYWGSATNWDNDTVPTFPAALTFGSTNRLTPVNDLTGVTITGLTFAASSGAFTLGGNPIMLGGNISIAAGGSVTNDQTLNLPITLSTSPTLSGTTVGGSTTVNNKGVLVINGAISGPFGLTSSGKNYVQFNGTNTYTGDTIITSLGSDISVSIGSDSAFGSGLVKFGATLGAPQLWAVPSGNRTITNNVDILTGLFIAHNATVAGKGAGGLTLAGNVLVHATSSIYCNANLTVTGPINGGSSAANGFILQAGNLYLKGNNTFTNTVVLNNTGYGPARLLNVSSDAALGHTNNSVRFDGSATFQVPASTNVVLAPSRVFNIAPSKIATFDIPAGSVLTVAGPVTNGGAIVKSNSGTLALAGANTYSGGTTNWGGTLSVTGDASLGAVPPVPATNLTFAASSTLRADASHALAASRMLCVNPNVVATFDTQGYTQTVNGVISGAPGSWLYKSGNGMLVLNPGADKTNSVWSLRTLAGTLAFVSGTHLVTSNTVWSQYKISDIMYVNGGTVLVGGGTLMTTGDGYVTIQNGALTVTNGTVNLNSLQELLNAYEGTGNTTVSGNGVLDLRVLRITQSGTPAVSNVVNVNRGGTIRLNNFFIDTAHPTPYGTVNLNGGTLVAKTSTDGFMGYNTGKWVTNVFFKVLAGGAVVDCNGNTVGVQLPLYSGTANDGGLLKRGAGMLTLYNTNTYNGVTSIEAGTFRLGVATNTLWADGSVLVASNAVFDVNGKIQTLAGLGGSGVVTNNSLLEVTVGIAPGGTNAIGTLTLAATPAALGGVFLADVATNGLCDCLSVQGNLNLSGLALNVADTGTLNKHQKYVIATYTGTLTGPFASAPLPERWHVKYDTSARQVYLSYDFGTMLLVR